MSVPYDEDDVPEDRRPTPPAASAPTPPDRPKAMKPVPPQFLPTPRLSREEAARKLKEADEAILARASAPRSSPVPAFSEADDPYGEKEMNRGDGIHGTSPGQKRDRIYADWKKRQRNKPWYAAGATAIMIAIAGAITFSFTKSNSAEKSAQATTQQLADLTTVQKSIADERDDRLKSEKKTHDEMKRIGDGVDLLLEKFLPASKRPKENQ